MIFCCVVFPLLTLAQEGESVWGDSIVADMREVTVYGRQSEEIVPSQRLAGGRLEALSSYSVADALRYFSGVQIKDYGGVGGLKTIDVRSMGTNHMGVFYDGIQLGNAQNGLVDLGRFSLENVEEIALYNGQKAQIFQSARDFGTSGSVYIKTRRPKFDDNKRFNLRCIVKGGSFGMINPAVVWEQRWSECLSSSLSAEYMGATGRYKFRYRRVLPSGVVAWDTTAVRQNGDIAAVRLEGSVFGRYRRGTWYAKGYYYDSERGIPGAIVNNVWRFAQRQWDRNAFVQGQWIHHVSDRYKFQLSAKYAYDRLRFLNPDTTLMYLDNVFAQHEFYLSTAHHLRIARGWEANMSVDYQYNSLSANLADFKYPKRNSLLVAFASQYEWGRFKALASLLGTNVFDVSLTESASLSRWTPAVYLSYALIRGGDTELALRAFYKKIFRMPTFNDLYYTEVGNAHLDPEDTQQFDLGGILTRDWYRGWLRHIEVKADGYYNMVDNKIVAIPKGSGQYRWMMMNIGKVRIAGVETTAETVVRPHRSLGLTLCANYTYQRAMDMTDPEDNDVYAGTYGGQIAYIPRHSGSVVANLAWRGLSINYSFVYVGERYHTSANIRENYEQPWYTHDLSLSYRHIFAKWRGRVGLPRCVTVALECNNVFDQQYEVVLNYPMPGRNWKGIVKIEL